LYFPFMQEIIAQKQTPWNILCVCSPFVLPLRVWSLIHAQMKLSSSADLSFASLRVVLIHSHVFLLLFPSSPHLFLPLPSFPTFLFPPTLLFFVPSLSWSSSHHFISIRPLFCVHFFILPLKIKVSKRCTSPTINESLQRELQ
jgi:hypothetical protein